MKQITITLPKGTTIFDVNGPNGVLAEDTAVAFDVHDAELISIDTGDAYDAVAAGLAAAGRTDILPLLAHEGADADGGAVHVAYTTTGRRVEQSFEEKAAADNFVDGDVPEGTEDEERPALKDLKRDALNEIADGLGLDGASYASKGQVIEAIESAQNAAIPVE